MVWLRRTWLALLVATPLLPACQTIGTIAGKGAGPAPSYATVEHDELARFAPVLAQQVASAAPGAQLDRPTSLDPDGSGTLADDGAVLGSTDPVPIYAQGLADSERFYLFYGFYYCLDWSGSGRAPRTDHRGDFEGALVIVSRTRRAVEAVITQAHKRFYLWTTAAESASAGGLPLTTDGRPVLFAESAGHGQYAFIAQPWQAKGGTSYPHGPASLPPETLLWISLVEMPARAPVARAEIRPLSEVGRWADARRRCFRDLPRGAAPPWFWRGGGAREGAIVRDPAALYAACRRAG